MRKIFLVLVASICSYHLWSQGTIELTAGATIRSAGNAYLVLDNIQVVNNGSLQQTSGNGIVKITGGLNVNLSGSSPTTFNQLLMAKSGSASLNLQRDLSVVSNVTFNGGLLNLNNNILDLGTTGTLLSESELSRAFTVGTGYIQVTGVLNNPSAVNLGNLGAVITSNTDLGSTIIRRGHKVQTGISGSNNSIQRYFDIMPFNNLALKAMLRFNYFDAELNGLTESSLYQWKSKDLLNWDFLGADTRDNIANYVEWKTYSKFDRVTLAIATAPAINCPGDIIVSANQNGCKALVAFDATATGIPSPTISYWIGNKSITSPYVFSKGSTVVTAIASNGVSPNASCSFTVTVVCGPVKSSITNSEIIPEGKTQDKLSVSARPNPSSGHFILEIKSNDPGPVTIKVMDLLGRVISVRSNMASNNSLIVGEKLMPGIYFVQAIQGKEVVTLKLIKQ